jgi:hypothetical protein
MDGKSFTLLIKHVSELRTDVLDNPHHKLTPDSFLIFLDKKMTEEFGERPKKLRLMSD